MNENINDYLKCLEKKVNLLEYKLEILAENERCRQLLYNEIIEENEKILNKIEYYDEKNAEKINNNDWKYMGEYFVYQGKKKKYHRKKAIIKNIVNNCIFDRDLNYLIKNGGYPTLKDVSVGVLYENKINWIKCYENNINPYKLSIGSDKKIYIFCDIWLHNFDINGSLENLNVVVRNFVKNKSCKYCGKHYTHWKDSLAYNYPQVAKMIAIKENNLTFEDCYKIACTNGEYYFKCNECGIVSREKKKLFQATKRMYSCEFCSDGNSMGNKVMNNLLIQLNVDFKPEYSPYYFRNTQHVDFLLTDYNAIIEVDGNYGNHTREYDYWRDFLNMKYGGYKTIRIDLTDDNKYNYNTFDYIKGQILNSELSNLFDLSEIDWNFIWEQCQKSKYNEILYIYENITDDVVEISKILNVGRGLVLNCLKQGSKHGKCSYTIEKSMENAIKKRSSIKHFKATLYEIEDLLNNKNVLCKKELLKTIGNINEKSFEKYIEPYSVIDISNIKGNHPSTKKLREKLKPYNGYRIIKIEKI